MGAAVTDGVDVAESDDGDGVALDLEAPDFAGRQLSEAAKDDAVTAHPILGTSITIVVPCHAAELPRQGIDGPPQRFAS